MRLRPAPFAALLLGVVVLTAGCSSSSSGGGSTTTSRAPEEVVVTNAEAAAGLATLGRLVADASSAAASGSGTVEAAVDDVWEQWEKIEGRVKQNDTGAYLEFEDALSDMRTGAKDDDAAKVQKGATAVTALIAGYLAKFPG
jgi:hypothetical protein